MLSRQYEKLGVNFYYRGVKYVCSSVEVRDYGLYRLLCAISMYSEAYTESADIPFIRFNRVKILLYSRRRRL